MRHIAFIVCTTLLSIMPSHAQGPASDPAAQDRAWATVKDSTNISALEAFIRRYPDTFYSDLAQLRIEELKAVTSTGAGHSRSMQWIAFSINRNIPNDPRMTSEATLAVKDARNAGPSENGKFTMPNGDVMYPVHVDYGPWANSNVYTKMRPQDFKSRLSKNECKP